ncbi:DUF4123 domain-containing protein [Pseudomonas japonica]|uniref:DUF4123 domain-containing protein n=1 Tax=Pseudomonas japonica TaxID=256466 RepID=A0A239HKK6_9PSED|nr:DUF4123 domain-containing protein [Pseudomonas japonica]SNS81842.1 protein of unknown function [Pseudomonas japonica]
MSLHRQLEAAGVVPRSMATGVYLLVEGAARTELQARLEFHDEPHRMLWLTDAAVILERHAPVLFQAMPGGKLDAWLGERFNDLSLSVIHARLDHDALCRQLRRFSKLEDDNGRYFLRLGDPVSLHLYVASLARAPAEVARFFADGDIESIYFHAPAQGLSRQVQPLFEQAFEHAERDGCLVWLAIEQKEEASCSRA